MKKTEKSSIPYEKACQTARDRLGTLATNREIADYADMLLFAQKSSLSGRLLLTASGCLMLVGVIGQLPVPLKVGKLLAALLGFGWSILSILAGCIAARNLHDPISPHDSEQLWKKDALQKGGATVAYAVEENLWGSLAVPSGKVRLRMEDVRKRVYYRKKHNVYLHFFRAFFMEGALLLLMLPWLFGIDLTIRMILFFIGLAVFSVLMVPHIKNILLYRQLWGKGLRLEKETISSKKIIKQTITLTNKKIEIASSYLIVLDASQKNLAVSKQLYDFLDSGDMIYVARLGNLPVDYYPEKLYELDEKGAIP